MAAGLTPFPLSPRLPPAAIAQLIRATDAHCLVLSKLSLPSIEEQIMLEISKLVPDYEIVVEDIPSLPALYPKLGKDTDNDTDTQSFALYPQTLSDTAVVLHSSGSTGMPKPIRQSFHYLASLAMVSGPGLEWIGGPRVRMAGMHAPPFHQIGNYILMVAPILNRFCINLFPASDGPPPNVTPDRVLDAMILNRTNTLMIVPLFLQIWLSQPKALDFLRQLKAVCYGGGPLAPTIGDALVRAGVRIQNAYGGTEFVAPTRLVPPGNKPMEWEWVEFIEDANVRWSEQGEGSGLFECIFLHSEKYAFSQENLPNGERGYATNDLFEKHPTKDGLWRLVGRKDDLLVHSNGEKTMPSAMEQIIRYHPLLTGALMFGHQRDRPGVLVDPKPGSFIDVTNERAVTEFRSTIWPVVAKANEVAPGYSKIYKEMILIASANKRPAYTLKGTISRPSALEMYHKEIDEIYARIDAAVASSSIQSPSGWAEPDVRDWLITQLGDLVGRTEPIMLDGDLFEQGLDSLGATTLRLRLLAVLKRSGHPSASLIDESTLYNYPSVNSLTSLVLGSPQSQVTMQDLIDTYSVGLETAIAEPTDTRGDAGDPVKQRKHVVLLTGSTGNLGSEILSRILSDETVERIFTYNRPSRNSTIIRRHHERFADKKLDLRLLESPKLVLLEGHMSSDKLSLDESDYERLKNEVTIIIHCSWILDFNLSLASFEGQIRATRNLIRLGREGRNPTNVKLVFISSVAAAQNWNVSKGLYPENKLVDVGTVQGTGYGESKYVAEILLAKSGLRAISVKVDQISGSEKNGAWATSDWVPVMLKTSLTLGMLPDSPGLVRWVSMEAAAGSVWDISRYRGDLPQSVNIVHPKPTAWTDFMKYLQVALAEHDKGMLPLVSWDTWIATLEQRAADTLQSLEQVPAVKLIDFFRSIGPKLASPVRFASQLAMELSTTLREAHKLDQNDVKLWVHYWMRSGL